MPPLQVHRLIIVAHARMLRPVPIVCDRERRTIPPIIEVPRRVRGVGEGGDVVVGEALVGGEGDGGLHGSILAEGIAGRDHMPVVGGFVGPS